MAPLQWWLRPLRKLVNSQRNPCIVRASIVASSEQHTADEPGIVTKAAQKAYKMAGIGPEEVRVVEVHDATAPAELIVYEELGLCRAGEGGKLIDDGVTKLGGRVPVNPSGGLLAKGHPVGATGVRKFLRFSGNCVVKQENVRFRSKGWAYRKWWWGTRE